MYLLQLYFLEFAGRLARTLVYFKSQITLWSECCCKMLLLDQKKLQLPQKDSLKYQDDKGRKIRRKLIIENSKIENVGNLKMLQCGNYIILWPADAISNAGACQENAYFSH